MPIINRKNWLIMVPLVSFLAALRMLAEAQSCNNGLGRLVYEKVSDYKLTGSFGKQHIESISREGLPIKVLEECIRRCQEDKVTAIEACSSFDFFPGHRRSSPYHKQSSNSYAPGAIVAEYEESKCSLYDDRGSPDGDDAFVRSDNSWHYNEICLNSNKISTDCPNRLYVFERIPGYRFDGHGDKEVAATNRSECEDSCISSADLPCRSATFDRVNSKCFLSKETRYMLPTGFKTDPNSDYLENMCLKRNQMCTSTAFVLETNKELDGAYERELVSAHDFQECSNLCLNSLEDRGFLCRSFLYDDAGHTCILYDEDPLFYGEVQQPSAPSAHGSSRGPSMADVKRPLKSSPGNLYRVHCVNKDQRDRSNSGYPFPGSSQFGGSSAFGSGHGQSHQQYPPPPFGHNQIQPLTAHESQPWQSRWDRPRGEYDRGSPPPYGGFGAGGGGAGQRYDQSPSSRTPGSFGPTYPDTGSTPYGSSQSGGGNQNPSFASSNMNPMTSPPGGLPPGHPSLMQPNPLASPSMIPPPSYNPIPYHSGPYGPPGMHPNAIPGSGPPFMGGPPVGGPQPHFNPSDRCIFPGGPGSPGLGPPPVGPTGLAAAPPARFNRVGFGTRLRNQYVTKILRAERPEDCEKACLAAADFNCRSFNFRLYSSGENCELSQYDSKQLKLDNPAHFEQNTPFDYFEREMALPFGPPGMGPPGLIPGGPGMYNAMADCLEVAQTCTPDGMEFTVKTPEGFYGRIYTYGFYDSCFYDGNGGTVSVLRISRANGFPRCGTQQYGDAMTNIVVVQFNDYVQTSRDKKYNLTCYFSGPGEAVVTSNYLDAKTDGRYPTQIEHLPAQNILTSNVVLRVLYRGTPTNTIVVGDLLTFRLEARGHYRYDYYNSDIFATNVIAKDPYTGRQVHLIDSRGCPVDLYVFPELHKTPDGALEAEFYAFKIPDSTFLVFQATVRTCRGPCEPVICQDRGRGHGSFPSWGRRRRDVSGQLDSNETEVSTIEYSTTTYVSMTRNRRGAQQSDSEDHEEDHEDEDQMMSSSEHVSNTDHGSETVVTGSLVTQSSAEVSNSTDADGNPVPEEEVHELFRVYLSRDDIPPTEVAEAQTSTIGKKGSKAVFAASDDESFNRNRNRNGGSGGESDLKVCLTSSGYYILVTAVGVLILVIAAMGAAAVILLKRSQLDFSDSLSGKIKLFHLNNSAGHNINQINANGYNKKQQLMQQQLSGKCNIYSQHPPPPPFINPVNSCNQLLYADHLTPSGDGGHNMDNGQYKRQIQFDEGNNGKQQQESIYTDPGLFERSRSLRSVTVQGPFHSKPNQIN